MNMNRKSTLSLAVSAVMAGQLLSYNSVALAQEKQSANTTLEEVVIIGSRVKGRTAEDLPVPVDVLSSSAMESTGHTEVGRMLQSLAPSFNFSSSSISDGTDALRPATLRGLGPDQTLVLINGKRRHQASLIHINTSVGRGTAGVDMNAIPAAAIERIEVLRDGAAAQYGSDAIAGVINIILKNSADAGKISLSYGEFKEGDGETTNVDINKGFEIGDGGFINATFNFRDRGNTNRAGKQGTCAFEDCSALSDSNGNGYLEITDPREITFDRDTFRIGDADSKQYAAALNAAHPLGEGEIYGFVTYSSRENESGAFYRNPSSGSSAYLADGNNVIPNGFLPLIESQIDDFSYSLGYTMDFDNGMSMDISYTDGSNEIDYSTNNSVNYSYVNFLRFDQGLSDAEIRASIPRSADAYGLELGLQTINLDFTHTLGELSLAFGAEMRTDDYQIKPGDAYAYTDFDTSGASSLYAQDASGGIQGFPGISPTSSVDEERDVMSAYVDGEYQVNADLIVSAAMRYDDYDGFGDTTNFKLAGNWAVTDRVSLRSAVSTGFRAPSMQQLYFNNIGTQFVNDPDNPLGPQIPVQVGTFRNDSQVAKDIGIPELKEEESVNMSFGIIVTPSEQVSITIDYYSIDIEDRIVISNQLDGSLSTDLNNALVTAGAGSGQFFLNGADTETTGVDIIVTYNGWEVLAGSVDVTLAANFTDTEVTDIYSPDSLADIPASVVFSDQDISIIEEWQPKDRISLSMLYLKNNWQVSLAFNRYGEYTVLDGGEQTYGAEILTDLNVRYEIDDNWSVNAGGNNIFDVYPDKNEKGNSRGGALESGGNLIVNSPGVFTYSRRSAPFGFNGAYYYAGVSYNF